MVEIIYIHHDQSELKLPHTWQIVYKTKPPTYNCQANETGFDAEINYDLFHGCTNKIQLDSLHDRVVHCYGAI